MTLTRPPHPHPPPRPPPPPPPTIQSEPMIRTIHVMSCPVRPGPANSIIRWWLYHCKPADIPID